MAAGMNEVTVQKCNLLVPATGLWGERTLLYQTYVVLSQSDIAFTFDSPNRCLERQIMLEDLIGIRVHAETDSAETSCPVDIHSLPLVSSASWFSRKETQSRKHKVDRILFGSEKTFQLNRNLALAWKKTVMQQCEKAVKQTFIQADVCASTY